MFGTMLIRTASLLPILFLTACTQPAHTPPRGDILLHAGQAKVHGTMLRYESQPHKNTLGYWVNVEDYATWEVDVTRAGRYEVEVLQGCGKGQGGSEVAVTLADRTLRFTVQDTGHFQNFVPRVIGRVKLSRGTHTLTVRPVTKSHDAVMDLRHVRLIPAR